MERKIGEIFEYNGEWYQCVQELGCDNCDFLGTKYCNYNKCSPHYRTNETSVIFKKLEKVGEPYTHYCPSGRIIYFQRYKIFNKSYSHNTEYIMCDFNEDDIVSIELKQTKEDMEEKKIQLKREDIDYLTRKIRYLVYKTNDYDRATEEIMNLFIPSDTEHSSSEKIGKNLKPFDLEAAKAGKPVCTRDGRKARIISCSLRNKNFPIAAIVEDEEENVYQFEANGVCDEYDENLDLMMLLEKKEGWVNVYRDCDGANITKDDNIYSSREAAIASAQFIDGNHYVATTKINWEEQLWDWISNYTLEI